jgi:hypothetical protein
MLASRRRMPWQICSLLLRWHTGDSLLIISDAGVMALTITRKASSVSMVSISLPQAPGFWPLSPFLPVSLLPGNAWSFYQFPVGLCSSLKLVLNHVQLNWCARGCSSHHTSSPWYDHRAIPFAAGFNRLADVEIQFMIPHIDLLVIVTIAIANSAAFAVLMWD